MGLLGHSVETDGSISGREERIVRTWRARVRAAIRSLGAAGFAVFVLGVCLLLLADALSRGLAFTDVVAQSELWVGVVREIGVAFIVAAVAVFGYEHLQHATKAVDQQLKLGYEIRALKELREREEKRAAGDALEALKAHLELIFRNGRHDDFRAAVLGLVRDVSKIRGEVERSDSSTESLEYIDYVTWLVQKFGRKSASNLGELLNGKDGSYEFAPPDRREVARRILIAQMNCMGQGDRYESITSVFLYAKDNGQLLDATKRALQRGLKVQRIFNVSALEEDPQRLRGEYYKVLRSRIQLQEDLSREYPEQFELRFFGRAFMQHVDKDLVQDARVRWQDLDKTYFGVFTKAVSTQAEKRLLFRADPEDLSLLTLRYCGKESERCELSELFVHLWELCEGAPNPFHQVAFDPKWTEHHWQRRQQDAA